MKIHTWMLRIGLATAVTAVVGCGGEPTSKAPDAPTGGESSVDVRKARKLMYEGEKALDGAQYGQAREFLRQADRFANSAVRDEMRVLAERIDKAEAKALVPDVVALGEGGKCAEALDDTAELAGLSGKGSTFAGFVREFAKEANVACLLGMLEAGDTLRHVRLVAASRTAKDALGPKAFKDFEVQLQVAVLAKVKTAVGKALEERKWAEVITMLRQVIKKGDAGSDDVADVVAKVQHGIRGEVLELIEQSMGAARGAPATLKQVDELLAIAWKTTKSTSGSAKGLQLPALSADLAAKRAELAFWVRCSAVGCRSSEPTKTWSHGDVPLTPVLEPKGKAAKTLRHGTPLWRIATAPGLALVATKDPGKLEGIGARVKPAAGWVPDRGLRTEDTSEWLPPGESAKGVRVWGPLRQTKQNYYEIGTVTAVQGGNLTVRRMADRKEVTIARARVQFGVVKKDLKVLAMCGGGFDLKPAMVLTVKETKYEAQGDPVVKVQCLGDDGKPTREKKDEQMGSLRVESKWLPPRH